MRRKVFAVYSKMNQEKIIGIDLGTTHSAAAILENGEPRIIHNDRGNRLTPSVVAFSEENEVLVGESGKSQAVLNRQRTVLSIKRKMGTNHKVSIAEREYSPTEISALILKKVKKYSEDYLGSVVEKAVITVPAYFNDNQRKATRNAGRIAGLDVIRIINEPTAAALSYGFNNIEGEENLLVFDLGGGTFDVSVLEVKKGTIKVKAVNGDLYLGGDDYDQRLVNYFVEQFKAEFNKDLRGDQVAMQQLVIAAENAKKDLSYAETTKIQVPYISFNENGPLHVNMTLTMKKFEEMTKDLLDRMYLPIKQVMEDAGMKFSDIDKVILVGGATRIPAVERFIVELSGKQPFKGVNPDECVAIGAAVQAGLISQEIEGMQFIDVISHTLGVEDDEGYFVPVISRNTPIPSAKGRVFTTVRDFQNVVDIHILQENSQLSTSTGERKAISANFISLGRFHLEDIPSAPKGKPSIEVTFDVDVNGIIHVTAQDMDTGKDKKVSITDAPVFSDAEVTEKRRLLEEVRT